MGEGMEKLRIEGYDRVIYQKVKAGWDGIAKPLDGMGIFEEFLARIGAIQGKAMPGVKKSRVIVCCADNGIVEEGVSQCGQEVTAICAENIANGRSSVAIMAKEAGVDVLVTDLGINTDKSLLNVRDEKVRMGTRNFRREPAMTTQEAQKAIQVGMDLVRQSKEEGMEILGVGEMGIGNTSTSSAIAAALLHLPAEVVTGRGAGLDDERLLHKRNVIQESLQKHGLFVEGEMDAEQLRAQALDALTKVGGLDIACMTGICLGGAKYHVPIVLDGLISMVAALVAVRLEPMVKEYLIPSHSGKEPAVKAIEKELDLAPVLHANMALGEGTGAVMMLQLLRTANAVYEKSVSFDAAGIKEYERFGGKA